MLQSQLLGIFRWSSETSELCQNVRRSCDCHMLIIKTSEDFRLWEIERINLNKLFFHLKNHIYIDKKNPAKKFEIQTKHVILCLYKNKHGCRRKRRCMLIMLLQMLQYQCKITGCFCISFIKSIN